MYILRLEVKQHVSALYGHHQVFFSFSLKVSLYKLRCGDLPTDYNSRDLCIGGYYITLIYIYSLSVGRGVVGFIPHRNLYSETLREKEKKPDDGHIRPKHVVLLLILEYTSFI